MNKKFLKNFLLFESERRKFEVISGISREERDISLVGNY
jgi:hypothetical protein